MSRAAEDTLEKVASEFEKEALADLEDARSQAVAKLEAARKEAAEAVSKTLEMSVKQAESIRRQTIGAAELEVRNAQLRSLEKAVTEVFEAAERQASHASGEAHEQALTRLVQEGLDVIGPRARIQCAEKDKRAVSSALRRLGDSKASSLTVEPEAIDTIGGVVLMSHDGSVRFDNTFEARLERMRPVLRKEVAALLTSA